MQPERTSTLNDFYFSYLKYNIILSTSCNKKKRVILYILYFIKTPLLHLKKYEGNPL